jgi:putative zinc ribbon protein
MKSPAAEYADFVEHPRYGKGPRLTGLDVDFTPDGKVICHWHSPPGVRIPKTAIAAHVPSQAPATIPVTHYYDAKRVCRKCGKPFLFFAEEQKYWYETLRFPLEADCLECVPCRKDEQQLRAARQKYDALLAATTRSDADTLKLVDCAVLLVESSVFSGKVLPKLRGFLKPLLADSAAPSSAQARALLSRIESIAGR